MTESSGAVRLHDRTFRPFIGAEAIAARIAELGPALEARLRRLGALAAERAPLFVGVLNGAAIFHADLTRACGFGLEIAYLRTRSYRGMRSTGAVDVEWPTGTAFAGRHVVVVEDIVDSGLTLATLTAALRDERHAASVTTVVLLDKPAARTSAFEPEFAGFEIEDRFVVGYGLDYDGLGRNLAGVYQVEG